MEKTSKIIRIDGLAATILEALRALKRLEIAWACLAEGSSRRAREV